MFWREETEERGLGERGREGERESKNSCSGEHMVMDGSNRYFVWINQHKKQHSKMGNGQSNLTQEELEEMQLMSSFNESELKRLYKRFRKIDTDNSGTITADEFQAIPGLAMNPLLTRVMAIFDVDGDGDIDFKEFISSLSVFSVNGEKEKKLKFAFSVYDIDNDGYISNGELFQVLKMMVGNNLSDTQLQQIVDKTIMESDLDGDGKISLEEFHKLVANTDIEAKMTIRF
eukprot:TRINITY_DN813_c0_g2_i3.p1 TRINITY_DN813_c0_g2~~TRINITY_DN813_c0_g2_i3.p1  ORF type:complete len:231 (+),score=77.82 TRINITY_DN813_c0_g2_i3:289-981(+)